MALRFKATTIPLRGCTTCIAVEGRVNCSVVKVIIVVHHETAMSARMFANHNFLSLKKALKNSSCVESAQPKQALHVMRAKTFI